jgi:transposase-like protein
MRRRYTGEQRSELVELVAAGQSTLPDAAARLDAIGDVGFADAARLRGELGRALARATTLAENLLDAAERGISLHQYLGASSR